MGRESLSVVGPVLLLANHPNSFLDAIVVGAQFNRPVHFLTRGDAFHKPWHNIGLRMLNMIPVYRLSEGKEIRDLNERAFQQSKEVLSAGGIVLIFIEGICLHTHRLQPFKKGAARIAWENRQLPGFSILPMGIAFDHFHRFGKEVTLHFGKPLLPQTLLPYEDEARSLICFNQILFADINQRIQVPVAVGLTGLQKTIFACTGWAGWWIHAPLYYPVKNLVQHKTRGTVYYDSVMFSALLFLYPLYLLLFCLLFYLSGIPLSLVWLIFFSYPSLHGLPCAGRKVFMRKHSNNILL